MMLSPTHKHGQWLERTAHLLYFQQGQDVYVACKLAMAELILSGCTTTSDHHYIYPNDVVFEDSIRAARCLGCCGTSTQQTPQAEQPLNCQALCQGDRDSLSPHTWRHEPG